MLDPDPDDILPEEATILDYGINARSGWAAVHLDGYGEYWAGVDLSTAYVVPYGEGLAVHYAFGGAHRDARLFSELWRFDVVGQRPPAVRPVARRSFPDGGPMSMPDALPGPLATVFDQLEVDVV